MQNQTRMRDMAELQKQASLMALAQNLQQMQEWQQNAPWREAERVAGIEKAMTTKDTYRRGQEAEIGAKELDLRKGKATETSDIAAKVAGNEQKISEASVAKAEAFANELGGSIDSWNPMNAVAEFNALADRHNMPANHPIRQRMAQARTPEQFKQMAKSLQQSLVNNIAQQRASSLQREKGDMDYRRAIDVANIGANASRDAARIRAQADEDMWNKNPANAFARAEQILTSVPENLDMGQMDAKGQAVLNQALQIYDRGLADKMAQVDKAIAQRRSEMLIAVGGNLSERHEAALAAEKKVMQDSVLKGAPGFYRRQRNIGTSAPAQTGNKITVQGMEYDVVERKADGSVRIRDPKTGRTGTVRP
jgi:hypothetical protein